MPMSAHHDADHARSAPEADLAARCAGIEVLIVDVDGVLTDGVIAIDDRGVETKHFHVRDGSGVALWRRAGKRIAILSGRFAPLVDRRAAELGISPVIQGVSSKAEPFVRLLRVLSVEPRQVCYVGDDLADLPALRSAGLAACPADAAPEVKAAAQLITTAPGGRGALREVVEVILKAQNHWQDLINHHDRPAVAPP
jgi:3-deoxy-D-manno-octulosonate 8-phosphate phosphatase (KDO 8-P phosphatase)